MGIGESLKKGLSATLHSPVMLLIYFVFGAVTNLVNAQLTAQSANATPGANPLFIRSISVTALMILLGIFFQSGLTAYMRDKVATGAASMGAFFQGGLRYYWRMLRLGLLVLGIVAVSVIIIVAINAAIGTQLRPLAVVVAVLVGIIALYMVVVLMLAPYAVVADDAKLLESARKSVSLATGDSFWTACFHFVCLALMTLTVVPMLFVLIVILVNEKARNNKFFSTTIVRLFIIGVVLLLVGFTLGVLLGLTLGLIGTAAPAIGNSPTVIAVLSSVVNAFVGALMTATYMVFYFRLTRKEIAAKI